MNPTSFRLETTRTPQCHWGSQPGGRRALEETGDAVAVLLASGGVEEWGCGGGRRLVGSTAESGSNLMLPPPWVLTATFSLGPVPLGHTWNQATASSCHLAPLAYLPTQFKAVTLRILYLLSLCSLLMSLSQRTGFLDSEPSGGELTVEPLGLWSSSALQALSPPLSPCPFFLPLFHQAAPLHFSRTPPPSWIIHVAQDGGWLSQARPFSYNRVHSGTG